MAIMTFIITNSYLTKASKYSEIDYDRGINEIHNYSLSISDEINRQKLKIEDKKIIQEIIDTHWNVDKNNKIFIANTEGKILFKVENVEAEKVDIFEIIKNNIQLQNIENYKYDYDIGRKEFVSINPLIFENEKAYIIVQGIPRAETVYYTKDKSVSAFFFSCYSIYIWIFIYNKKEDELYRTNINRTFTNIKRKLRL